MSTTAAPVRSPEEVRAAYRYWQRRLLLSTIVGYALFYFVRKNLSVAMPAMEHDLHITKTQLGAFLTAHGLIWMLNGWFQGMGFPPCARLMTHWFPPKVLATKMAIWNSSHSVGASLVVVLCGYLVQWDWRLCFQVPAAMALVGAAALVFLLRDTPESMGLPPVAGTENVN